MDEERRKNVLRASLAELVEHGYAEFEIESACSRASVAVSEFKAEFGDKDGCLFTAYEMAASELHSAAASRCDGELPWPERVREGRRSPRSNRPQPLSRRRHDQRRPVPELPDGNRRPHSDNRGYSRQVD